MSEHGYSSWVVGSGMDELEWLMVDGNILGLPDAEQAAAVRRRVGLRARAIAVMCSESLPSRAEIDRSVESELGRLGIIVPEGPAI